MKNKFTRLLIVPMALTFMSGAASCGGSSDSITVWTFSTELKNIVSSYYTPDTGNKATVVVKSSVTQIQSELANAIHAGNGIPDVIALEAAVVADFTSMSST